MEKVFSGNLGKTGFPPSSPASVLPSQIQALKALKNS
jgi:hypothetical protein